MEASKYRDAETVQRLLDRGADVKAEDLWGETALEKAVEGKHIGTAYELIENIRSKN
ncbi:MAG: hypothetical protein OXJ52_01130 [Oligoflexia bacterium]|nr:hypothetical protein [Oligoflexia bacterium]